MPRRALTSKTWHLARMAPALGICAFLVVASSCSESELPAVKAHQDTSCQEPGLPPIGQVDGPSLDRCMPAEGPYEIEVRLTIGRDGRVVGVRLPESLGRDVVRCIRRLAPKMVFFPVERCGTLESEITQHWIGLPGQPGLATVMDTLGSTATAAAGARR